ncbi:MAG TPA: alanyl-tRNA editing protein [Woeseiaceae bacterium]|nr:alanyl-tRNA editing protein [Woeseiaceae bacterium]
MTERLFEQDAYLQECVATAVAADEDGIVLDRTVFYPLGGGQPGDRGWLETSAGERIGIVDTRKGEAGAIRHVPAGDAPLPAPGEQVRAVIDWELRYRHMRMHTCLHLVGAVIPHGVTGGNISAAKSRLDFDMEETLDKEAVTAAVNALVAGDHEVQSRWITSEELREQPELVRTMSVSPPMNAGHIRLLEIPGVDLQPCGGTHVRRTGEIGPIVVSKIEKKGRHNRRVNIVFADA